MASATSQATVPMADKVVLITGANSGIGLEAAYQFANHGYGHVILACRSLDKAEVARKSLVSERGARDIYSTVAVDVSSIKSSQKAAEELLATRRTIDTLVLNAGAGSDTLKMSEDNIEHNLAAGLIGHHVLAMALLRGGAVAVDARIILAGSEIARGNLAGTKYRALDAVKAAKTQPASVLDEVFDDVAHHRVPEAKKYAAMDAYGTSKIWCAWWVGALARMVPEHMVVVNVSPGSVPNTGFVKNMPAFMKVAVPILTKVGKHLHMAQSIEDGAMHYVDAAKYTRKDAGKLYASAGKKMVGPVAVQLQEHLHDQVLQDATWRAVVRLTGVDLVLPQAPTPQQALQAEGGFTPAEPSS